VIDLAALAICKQRGHDAHTSQNFWSKCKWCGMWLREVRTIEEREDEPPAAEQSPFDGLEHLHRKLEGK
jgi:hypothetical protein